MFEPARGEHRLQHQILRGARRLLLGLDHGHDGRFDLRRGRWRRGDPGQWQQGQQQGGEKGFHRASMQGSRPV
jgi:hypothetical protein